MKLTLSIPPDPQTLKLYRGHFAKSSGASGKSWNSYKIPMKIRGEEEERNKVQQSLPQKYPGGKQAVWSVLRAEAGTSCSLHLGLYYDTRQKGQQREARRKQQDSYLYSRASPR